jgi:hypothetical protein
MALPASTKVSAMKYSEPAGLTRWRSGGTKYHHMIAAENMVAATPLARRTTCAGEHGG